MLQFFEFCVVAYMLVSLVWFLINMFLFERSFKTSIMMAPLWPITVFKLKTGLMQMPNSFYSQGDTHGEYKRHHHPDEVPPSSSDGELKTVKGDEDGRNESSPSS